MPSITDIPEHLHGERNPEKIIDWLQDAKVDRFTAMHLFSLWAVITATKPTQAHYQRIGRFPYE